MKTILIIAVAVLAIGSALALHVTVYAVIKASDVMIATG